MEVYPLICNRWNKSAESCDQPMYLIRVRHVLPCRHGQHSVVGVLDWRHRDNMFGCVGLLCDLLWSDPEKEIQGWGENDRGVSFTFGNDVVCKFLDRHELDLICRAHQVVEDGYEFFAKRQLVTLFSAPNYCGEFDNAGAMMSVDETLMCSFQVSTFLPRLCPDFTIDFVSFLDFETRGEKTIEVRDV